MSNLLTTNQVFNPAVTSYNLFPWCEEHDSMVRSYLVHLARPFHTHMMRKETIIHRPVRNFIAEHIVKLLLIFHPSLSFIKALLQFIADSMHSIH